jgi:hypothetical protein
MAGTITGRVNIKINGEVALTKAGATAKGIGSSGKPAFEREPIFGDTGLHGFVEKPIAAECEVTISDRSDVKLSDIADINGNGTIIFEAQGGGKVYTMPNATCTGNIEVAGGQGETKVKFVGPYWVES